MLSLRLATVIPEVPPLASHSPPKYHSFSSIKACSTAGNRTGEGELLQPEKNAVGLPGELQPELIPRHVAILDGNGSGVNNLSRLVSNSSNLGIKVLSTYAFSTNNLSHTKVIEHITGKSSSTSSHYCELLVNKAKFIKKPMFLNQQKPQSLFKLCILICGDLLSLLEHKLEVDFLLRAYEDFIRSDVTELITREDLQFSAIGNISRLPESLQTAILSAEEMSQFNKGMHFLMALSYNGRDEIVKAAKMIVTKVERRIIRTNDVDDESMFQHLMINIVRFPIPDLLIRTRGELGISNFLLWQFAYSEFYFVDKMFHEFGEDDLVEALTFYQQRKRRYDQGRNVSLPRD